MIKVRTFDLADGRELAVYTDILNSGKKILQELVRHAEGYFYVFLKYEE